MSHQGSQHPMFDLSSHSEVVWDEEPQKLDGEMDNPLECKHTMFKAAIVSTSDGQRVFDELSSQVVWDEELLQGVESHDSLLKILAHGECLVDVDDKPIAELVPFKVPMATKDDEGELFDGMHCMDVIWDEEPHHGFDSHGLLQEHAEGIDDQMQGKQEVSVEILCDSALWDELPANFDSHDGLLQQLEYDGQYLDDANPQLTRDELLADEDSLTSITKLGLDVGNYGLEETLEFHVLDIDQASDETFKEADDNLQLEGHLVGTFQLLQEYGMDVADQMLEHMHKPVNFKAPVLSECGALKVTQFGEHLVDGDSKPMAAAMEDRIIIGIDTPFLLVLCMDLVDVIPTNFGVHEDLTPPIVTYDNLLQQSAFGKAYMDDEKNNLIVWLGDDKVLTHAGDSSQYPEVGLVAANHGLDKLLKHNMVDSDNLYYATLFKANNSLQLEEVGAGFGRRLPSAESVAVHFSPQCLNQDSKNTFFLVLYEECVGQEMKCDHEKLVVFDERQKKVVPRPVIAKLAPWRQNTFSPRYGDMEVVHDKIPSWNRSDFSLGRCEKRFFSAYSDIMLSVKVFKSTLLVPAYLIVDGLHRFRTGGSRRSYSGTKKCVIVLLLLLWDQKYKRLYISIRQWDPGIMR